MMQPKDHTRLKHMMEYAEEAKNLAMETTREKLATDRKLELALTRLVEIIGEAAGRVSTQTREQYPDIPVDRNDRSQKPADPWLRCSRSGYPLGYS